MLEIHHSPPEPSISNITLMQIRLRGQSAHHVLTANSILIDKEVGHSPAPATLNEAFEGHVRSKWYKAVKTGSCYNHCELEE